MLTRKEILEYLASTITDELTVGSVGLHTQQWAVLIPKEKKDSYLFRAYMAGTTPISLGLALALPHRKIVALDGDGSLLMSLSILPAIANMNPSNLIVLVFDNEAYEFIRKGITRQISSFTANVASLVDMAKGAGIKNARQVEDLPALRKAYSAALKANGPSLIDMKVAIDSTPLPRVPFQGVESKFRFARHIEETEKLESHFWAWKRW